MKKTLAILLALVAIGSVAFAQVTLSGYNFTVMTVNADGVSYSNKLRINGSAITEDKVAGVKFRLQDSTGTWGVSYAYGFVNLFENQLNLSAGKLYNTAYDVGSGMSNLALGNVSNIGWENCGAKGVSTEITPAAVAGLKVGFIYKMNTKLFAAVKYDAEKFGLIVNGDVDVASPSTYDGSLTVAIKAVEGLEIDVGAKYNIDDSNIVTPFGIVEYDAEKFSVQVAPEFLMNVEKNTNEIYVEGGFNYKINDTASVLVLGAFDSTGTVLEKSAQAILGGAELNFQIQKATLNFGANATFCDSAVSWALPCYLLVTF